MHEMAWSLAACVQSVTRRAARPGAAAREWPNGDIVNLSIRAELGKRRESGTAGLQKRFQETPSV